MSFMEIKELLSHSDASGARSNVLKPLTWFLAIITVAFLLACKENGIIWVQIFFAVILGVTVFVFLGVFIYCLIKNPDSLRSESFTIQKIALEKGVYGDNQVGFFNHYADKQETKSIIEKKVDNE